MATPNRKAQRAQDRFKHKVLHRAQEAKRKESLFATPTKTRPSSSIEIPRLMETYLINNIAYDINTGDTLLFLQSVARASDVISGNRTEGSYSQFRSVYFQTRSGLQMSDLAVGLGVPSWKINSGDYHSPYTGESLLRTVGMDTAQIWPQARKELSDRLGF